MEELKNQIKSLIQQSINKGVSAADAMKAASSAISELGAQQVSNVTSQAKQMKANAVGSAQRWAMNTLMKGGGKRRRRRTQKRRK